MTIVPVCVSVCAIQTLIVLFIYILSRLKINFTQIIRHLIRFLALCSCCEAQAQSKDQV